MKLHFFTVLAALFVGASAFAGAANTDIVCQSSSGITLKGNVPGDFADFDVTVSSNGKSSRMYSNYDSSQNKNVSNGDITVVQALTDRVWTMYISHASPNYGFVQLYAIPASVKYHALSGGFTASFSGKLYFNLSDIESSSVNTIVNCRLKQEI